MFRSSSHLRDKAKSNYKPQCTRISWFCFDHYTKKSQFHYLKASQDELPLKSQEQFTPDILLNNIHQAINSLNLHLLPTQLLFLFYLTLLTLTCITSLQIQVYQQCFTALQKELLRKNKDPTIFSEKYCSSEAFYSEPFYN